MIPEINLKKISYVIGKNTNEAVRSGFYWGYAGLIDNMIKLIKRQTRSDFKVILTGGLADLYKKSINTKCTVDKDLTIKGIIKNNKKFNLIMKEELLFCPLGGSGEIGMNLNLYAYGKPENQKWIIVDVGVTFADDSVPGIDLIYPDPGFIVDKKDDVLGIILTHAHEDHIGAIAHIWPKLKCNIYATPFTAVLVREKFKEKKIDITSNLKIVELNGNFKS